MGDSDRTMLATRTTGRGEAIASPGLCRCGCGTATSLIGKTDRGRGLIAGEYRRFAPGHHRKLAARENFQWAEEDRGFGTPCWTWQGYRNSDGYGQTGIRGKKELAHRVLYEQRVGVIPPGLDLDHKCDVRACVNPAHLQPETRAVNARRGKRAKINSEIAADIRDRGALAGELILLLAQEYGIAPRTVLGILLGERWAQAAGHSHDRARA